ncbi:MAG: hypothetical protein R2880_04345 [Deinococcales bacterium]
MVRDITKILLEAAQHFATPLYVYDFDKVAERYHDLKQIFQGRFDISFAIKANPNLSLLTLLREQGASFDASSYAEVMRAMQAGVNPKLISFTGPGKRREEIYQAVSNGIGVIVVESLTQIKLTNEVASLLGKVQDVVLRINPQKIPKAFGAKMSGKASQFGVDEEMLEQTLTHLNHSPSVRLVGAHIYSGSNSLQVDAIVENFAIFRDIFRKVAAHTQTPLQKLIWGAGFGVPYHQGQEVLDIQEVGRQVIPIIDELRNEAAFKTSQCTLELGRWLVAPAGWLLSTVVDKKLSRGTEICICDAGFNNHLAACGMMGSVLKRNWPIINLSRTQGDMQSYKLVGPLCTSIDVLSHDIELPQTEVGDVLAIEMSGAYGLTASPTRFISHPEPKEIAFQSIYHESRDLKMFDISESALNHWELR